MEQMIVGLLNGDIRHWGPLQFRLWNKFFVRTEAVGFELEVNDFEPLTNLRKSELEQLGFVFSWWKSVENFPVDTCNEFELTYLFRIMKNPITFINTVKACVQTLHEQKVPTLGAVHINVNATHKLGKLGSLQKDAVHIRHTEGRYEYKTGFGFLTYKDLMFQLVYYIILTYDNTFIYRIELHKIFIRYTEKYPLLVKYKRFVKAISDHYNDEFHRVICCAEENEFFFKNFIELKEELKIPLDEPSFLYEIEQEEVDEFEPIQPVEAAVAAPLYLETGRVREAVLLHGRRLAQQNSMNF